MLAVGLRVVWKNNLDYYLGKNFVLNFNKYKRIKLKVYPEEILNLNNYIMETVFLIGGSGLIGKQIEKKLNKEKYKVFNLDIKVVKILLFLIVR